MILKNEKIYFSCHLENYASGAVNNWERPKARQVEGQDPDER
jgi:hypothetical protein